MFEELRRLERKAIRFNAIFVKIITILLAIGTVLSLIFMTLRLCSVIDWHWALVFLPTYGVISIFIIGILLATLVVTIRVKQIEKEY